MSENGEYLLSNVRQSFPFPLITPVGLNPQDEGVGNAPARVGSKLNLKSLPCEEGLL